MNAEIQKKIPEIQNLFRKYGAQKAFLFGSAAADTMTDSSDVDFLFQFKEGLDYENYGNNYFDLLYGLQDLLSLSVDLVAIETLSNPYLIQKIDSQKIALL